MAFILDPKGSYKDVLYKQCRSYRGVVSVPTDSYNVLADWAVKTGASLSHLCGLAISYANENLRWSTDEKSEKKKAKIKVPVRRTTTGQGKKRDRDSTKSLCRHYTAVRGKMQGGCLQCQNKNTRI